MGKVVSGSFPPMTEPRAVEHVIPTIKLRMAKEHILNEANRIHKEHGHFKASASGNPTLVYGEGHDMKHHGEGKPYHHVPNKKGSYDIMSGPHRVAKRPDKEDAQSMVDTLNKGHSMEEGDD